MLHTGTPSISHVITVADTSLSHTHKVIHTQLPSPQVSHTASHTITWWAILIHSCPVLTSRGERKNQEGALPRPISSGSREKKELRSRREGHRGGLIRALAAAAPSAPLGEPPIPTLATSKAPLLISSQRKGWRGGQHSQDWEKDREDGDRDKQREMGRGRGDKETEGEKDGETGGRDGVMEGVETGRERCEDRDRVIWEREAQRE